MHIASEHIRAERAGAGRSGARVRSAPVVAEAAGAQAWAFIGSPGVKLVGRMKEPAQ